MAFNLTPLLAPPNRWTKITLWFLSLSAWYAIWGLSISNGTLLRMWNVRHATHPILPGTSEPLKTSFTGIFPIDYFCTVMTLFFWETVNGSRPDASVVGLYFLPQALGILLPIWVEGLRSGNVGKRISYVNAWAFTMQSFSVGCIAPLFFAAHLSTSPTALDAGVQMRPKLEHVVAQPLKLPVLQLAVLLGYIIPGVFLTLPSPQVSTYAQQQVAIVIWVLFPLWVAGLQAGLYALSTNLLPAERPPQSTAQLGAENIRSLRLMYASAFGLCSIAHIAILSLSMVSFVFPMLFAPGYPSAFHPLRLMFPANPSTSSSIGEGSMNFLQWDQWIGYSAALLWAMTQHQNARSKKETIQGWMVLLAKVAGLTAIAGPGGALIAVTWARDEFLLAVDIDEPKGKAAELIER